MSHNQDRPEKLRIIKGLMNGTMLLKHVIPPDPLIVWEPGAENFFDASGFAIQNQGSTVEDRPRVWIVKQGAQGDSLISIPHNGRSKFPKGKHIHQ